MKTNTGLLALILTLVAASPLFAQESKMDTLLTITKDIQKDVKSQVESRLGNRQYGVEVSPFYLLASEKNTLIFRGGFSWFGVRPSSEIYVPVSVINTKDYDELFVDVHFREYFAGVKRGFYYEALVRYLNYSGKMDPWDAPSYNETGSRLGIGFGIGTRIFAKNGLYWGASFSFGRYLTGKSYDEFSGFPISQMGDMFLYSELVRIGFAF